MFEYCRVYVGQRESPQRLLEQLLALDYERQEAVADAGEVAVRGGVVDIFPATFESPLRIEFDGSRIVSMRSYNPKTLETLDHHAMVVLLPRRIHGSMSIDIPFESCVDLAKGDYVVHLDHGIGRYAGRTAIAGHQGPDRKSVV